MRRRRIQHMHDQRVVGWAAFGGKDFGDSRIVGKATSAPSAKACAARAISSGSEPLSRMRQNGGRPSTAQACKAA
jgi:hypothetical protein